MIFITLFVALFIGIVIVFLTKKYDKYIHNNEEEYIGKIMPKNIFLCIGLIIITGLIFTFYEIFLTGRYPIKITYDALVGIIVIFMLLFYNLLGYIQLIINANKIYIIIIFHIIFIVSTILVYKITNYCVNVLIAKDIISECSSILFILIIMIIENIISYILIKIYMKIKYKKRSNDT